MCGRVQSAKLWLNLLEILTVDTTLDIQPNKILQVIFTVLFF